MHPIRPTRRGTGAHPPSVMPPYRSVAARTVPDAVDLMCQDRGGAPGRTMDPAVTAAG